MRTTVLVGGLICLTAGIAHGGIVTLDANMTADNSFTAYVSSDPNLAGDEFLSGGNWMDTFSGSYEFENAGTYYLHVHAHDAGSPEMFIGLLTLSNSNGSFSNGSQTLVTNHTEGWASSVTGFGGPDVGIEFRANNGAPPWGFVEGMGDAVFIWSGDLEADDVYFSTVITVVPSPGVLGVLGVGGAVAVRRRR